MERCDGRRGNRGWQQQGWEGCSALVHGFALLLALKNCFLSTPPHRTYPAYKLHQCVAVAPPLSSCPLFYLLRTLLHSTSAFSFLLRDVAS